MKVLKRIAIGIMAALLLCGCGNSKNQNQEATTVAATTANNEAATTDVSAAQTGNSPLRNSETEASLLYDLQPLAVFKGVSLDFSGYSPNVSATVNIDGADSIVKQNVTFVCSPDSNLSDGDTVQVMALYNTTVLNDMGYYVPVDVLEFTVEAPEIPYEDIKWIDPFDYMIIDSMKSDNEGTIYIPKKCFSMPSVLALAEFESDNAEINERINDAEADELAFTFFDMSSVNLYCTLYVDDDVNVELFGVSEYMEVPIGTVVTAKIECNESKLRELGIGFTRTEIQFEAWDSSDKGMIMYLGTEPFTYGRTYY